MTAVGFDGVERRGLMFVLSSPSGAGKTTLSRMLIERSPGRLARVVAETDIFSAGIRSIKSRDSVVLPAPDGEDSTNIRPRRSSPPMRRP